MKRVFCFCIGLCLMFGLFAAGEQETVGTDAIAEVDPTGAEVLYWYQHNRAREEGLQTILARFNEGNEYGIKVTGEYQGGYGDLYNKMITAIAGNSMPNVVVAYQNQAAMYAVSDALVDLNPYVNSPMWGLGDELSDFFEGFINQDVNAMFDGARLGFPPNRSLEVMYYNKDWLAELGYSVPPKTWDEFREYCRKATESGEDKYGYAIRTDASNVFAMAISRGGDFTTGDGKSYKLNSKEIKDSLVFMKELLDDGTAIRIAERYGDQTDFANSKILFFMGSTSGLPYVESGVNGSDNPFDWSVAPIPYDVSKPVLDVYGASLSVCKSTPEKQLASWLLVKYLTSVNEQAEWVRISNYFPVRKSVADNLEDYFQENPKYADSFNLLQTSDTMAEPPFAGYDEVRDAISAAFHAILDGADPDAELDALNNEANEILSDSAP